jgi:hypothetical protein
MQAVFVKRCSKAIIIEMRQNLGRLNPLANFYLEVGDNNLSTFLTEGVDLEFACGLKSYKNQSEPNIS